MDEFRQTLEENRESKLAQLEADLARVERAREDALRELEECRRVERRAPEGVRGDYEPKLVEEQYEFGNHQQLFYFPKPVQKVA